MSKYLFLFRGGYTMTKASPESQQASMVKWKSWMETLAKQGKLLGGEPLEYTGKTISGRSKEVMDGPYAEGKEAVGGYLLVEAANAEEAVELSKGCPIFESDGSVEVRPLMAMDH